ncbi:GHKL domain-containing protein [uncultured Limosilactobacillus sp.]|uniref:GHKL domain-containing protein n=1 Tax=uncultured Limosilactobacillus sp. TaxID=2837629 RepID=UPI00265E588F|nr:GHKL domain-containing protein [uncultured Limosilactobacillus sp.]
MIGCGYTWAYLSTILEGSFLYLYFKNRTSKPKLIGAILLTLTTSILTDFSTFTIDEVLSLPTSYILFIDPFFYLFIFILLYHYNPLDKIEEENATINLWILFYLFITLNIAGFIIFTTSRITPAFIVIFCLLVLQCSFTVFIYRISRQIQQKKLQLQEKKDLLFLIQNLEENQSKLRRFKHDYQNLLNSLRLSAIHGDNQALLDKLESYSRDNLGKDSLWQFQDTKNIKDDVLRSIFISKLNSIYQKDIKYHFECLTEINNLPNIDLFDLIRIIGIAYDNALEECETLKKLGARTVEINSMLYQSAPNKLEFEIKNTCRKQLSTNKLHQEGITNKTNHEGLGLATAQKIANKYHNVYIAYSSDNGYFTFTISIE